MSLNGGPFNVSIWNLQEESTPLIGETPSHPAPGAFGRFEVLHQIGAGTLGPVFLARDPERARSVAVKVFHLDINGEQAAELASRLVQLAQANLVHPSIVVPFDAGLEGSTAYIAEEYFAAESLDGAIRQYGPPPVSQALRILSAVAGALDFAAVAGVQHGALHPRDLLVTPDDTHVTGFGVARALEAIGLRAPMRRPYVAPERVQRENWDGRADIYSLAVLARDLLVGRSRGGQDTVESRLPDDQEARLRPVLAKAMAARPSDRFASSLELMSAVQDALVPSAAGVVGVPRAQRAARESGDLLLPLQADEGSATGDEQPLAGGVRLRLHEDEDAGIPPFQLAGAETSRAAEVPAIFPGLDLDDRPSQPVEPADEWIDLTDLDILTAEMAPLDMPAPEEEPGAGAPAVPAVEDLQFPPEDTPGQEDALSLDDQVQKPSERFDVVTGPVEPVRDRVIAAPATFAVAPEPIERERRQSRALPMLLILFVGLAIGAVGGYLVATRSAPSRPAPTSATPPAEHAGAPDASATGSSQPAAARPLAGSTPGSVRPTAPARPSAPAAANGILSVRSTPRGASVTVNGIARGVTPLRLRGLAPGRYSVRVARRGYDPAEREVVVSADRRSSSVLFSLVRASRGELAGRATDFYGTVSVDSLPAGARVFVDGRLLGTTPIAAARVAAGSHVVRVDRTGFRPWTSPIQVVSGKPLRVTASLEREPR